VFPQTDAREVGERLDRALRLWRLEPAGVLGGGWNAHVVECVTDDAVAVVLKLPNDPGSVALEAVALRWWGDSVAARVIADDAEIGALLLERLVPGTAVEWAGVHDTDRVIPLLGLLGARPSTSLPPLPTLAGRGEDMIVALEDAVRAGGGGERSAQIEAAVSELRALLRDRVEATVLHGDLVPANILISARGERVIDPRPCLGDRHYDLAYWAVFSGYGHDAAANLERLAAALDADLSRLRRWAYVLAVNRLVQIGSSAEADHPVRAASLRSFVI
jgi:streptomycin 6-kinase